MASMTYFKNRDDYYLQQESDIDNMLRAASLLQNTNGCEEIVETLKTRIEDAFRDIPVENKQKKLDGATYYPNGLVSGRSGEKFTISTSYGYEEITTAAIICAPYELPETDQKPQREATAGERKTSRKATAEQNCMMYDLMEENQFTWAQLCIKIGKPMIYSTDQMLGNKNINVRKAIRFLSECATAHEKNLDISMATDKYTIQRTCSASYGLLHSLFSRNRCFTAEGLDVAARYYTDKPEKWVSAEYLKRQGIRIRATRPIFDEEMPEWNEKGSLGKDLYGYVPKIRRVFDTLEKIQSIDDKDILATCRRLNLTRIDLSCKDAVIKMIQDTCT